MNYISSSCREGLCNVINLWVTNSCTAPIWLYRMIKKSLCTCFLCCKNQVHRDFLIAVYIMNIEGITVGLCCSGKLHSTCW